MSFYGSPFRNTDSGILLRDSLNDKRVRTSFEKFWKSKADDKEFQAQIKTSVSEQTVKIMTFAGPILGLLVLGKSYNDMFCNPKYFYFRAFLLVSFTLFGNCMAIDCKNRYEYSLYTRNYHLFPKELQQALVNGDARYCIQWWNVPQGK